jgi:hypothetical protein
MKAIKLVLLSAAGIAGMIAGGQLWGLLGTALFLVAIWWVCEDIRLAELDREIQRVYYSDSEPVPVQVQKERSYADAATTLARTASHEDEQISFPDFMAERNRPVLTGA